MGENGSGMGVLGVIGRTSSLTCSAFSGVTLSRKMRPSSALPQVLLRVCQIARHAASCRRRELRLSLASRDSSLKLSEDASSPRGRAPAARISVRALPHFGVPDVGYSQHGTRSGAGVREVRRVPARFRIQPPPHTQI
jgi:hypothetical protein